MRRVALVMFTVILAGCTGQGAPNTDRVAQPSDVPEPASGVTVSGSATIGYSKGG